MNPGLQENRSLKKQFITLGIIGFVMTSIRWGAHLTIETCDTVGAKALQVWQWTENRLVDKELKKRVDTGAQNQ